MNSFSDIATAEGWQRIIHYFRQPRRFTWRRTQMTYVILQKDCLGGFDLFGDKLGNPFPGPEAARQWAEEYFKEKEWVVVPLKHTENKEKHDASTEQEEE